MLLTRSRDVGAEIADQVIVGGLVTKPKLEATSKQLFTQGTLYVLDFLFSLYSVIEIFHFLGLIWLIRKVVLLVWHPEIPFGLLLSAEVH